MSTLPPAARLVAPLPADPAARVALFTVRRMGAHGLADAQAAWAVLATFGRGFRRPLLLTRALMVELAGTARRTIAIAPCCCARVTASEDALLALLTGSGEADDLRPRARDLLGASHVDHVLAAAAAVAVAYADAGRPLGG